jgi:predicted peptidase
VVRTAAIIAGLALAGTIAFAGEAPRKGGDVAVLHGYEAGELEGMPYRWMKPIDYDPEKTYPLVISLHGRSGVGADNRRNLVSWHTKLLNQDDWRRRNPCFVIAPQNTFAWVRVSTVRAAVEKAGKEEFLSGLGKRQKKFVTTQISQPDYSSLEIVFDIIKKFQKDFKIDESRIYVIGNSMGGFGVWAAISEEPELFAAGIALCGGPYRYKDFEVIKDVPLWAFHGVADKNVSYTKYSRRGFDGLKAIGGNCKLTSLKGEGHSIWEIALRYTGDDEEKGFVTEYASDKCDKEGDVWKWLFSQRKPAAADGGKKR